MDDLELIRNFRSSVEQPTAPRIARARTALATEVDAPARHPRHRFRPALAALVPAAGVAAAVLALTGAFGSGGASVADAAIIHHADAALTPPPNMILHVKVAGDGFVAESWQLTSPPYSVLEYKGPIGATTPQDAQDGTTSSYWDPATNSIHVLHGASPQTFENPIAQVKQALHAGQARVTGSATQDGVQTYAITFSGTGALTVYVDKSSYRPVAIDDPQRDGTVVHLQVLALEYLPANDVNRQLLALRHWHPTARVVTDAPSAKLTPTK
ncbi:MAG TPA: hypothetical protein VGX45_13150 [Solirubrobacteraceae bacterium]|jgi:hypothetical protein|nr:hypothetical protein [Solirubrobacteraceae bacterium]